MTVKLLTEQHLEFLSLKAGCTGSSESTLVKMVGNHMSRLICFINDFKKVYFYFQDKEVGDPIRTFRVCDNDSTITHIEAEVSVSLVIVVHPIQTNCLDKHFTILF